MINLDHAWQRVIVQSDHITSEHVANYNSRVTITHKNGKCNKSRVNLTIQKSRVTKSDHITSEHVSNYKLRVDITNDHAWSKGIISRVNTFQIINHEWTSLMIWSRVINIFTFDLSIGGHRGHGQSCDGCDNIAKSNHE